ncbi:MAG TPA: rhomboid family intramembrane serine protease [Thermoanaerobaculia bacterium]|nr:rhomboid family intramembrane serine protease [Thermoanaerobaculia bacterium]
MIPLRDRNPRRRISVPAVTLLLIAANVALFAYELSLGPRLETRLLAAAFVPARLHVGGGLLPALAAVRQGLVSALVSMFLHGGILHLAGNMLFLWIFGDNVEDRLGHLRFLVFYLVAGLAATGAHAWANPHSQVPAIGASGAISGVLGAYLVLYPRARIVTMIFLGFFIRLVELPAVVFLPIWFLMQFMSGVASLHGAPGGPGTADGGVAWFAHIGGFLAGPLLLFLLDRRPRMA